MIQSVSNVLAAVGGWVIFTALACQGTLLGRRARGELVPVFNKVGTASVGVIMLTGLFIGMVLAVQVYGQFASMGLATWVGAVTNYSVLRELGPVLAATMLAGRVGSAMAAELGTMRVTEQIDALSCLGVNPVHYLVAPRLLACVLLIPLLTIIADMLGMLGSALVCLGLYGLEPYHYWERTRQIVGMWDMMLGLLKSVAFGAAIALISCHRGFNCRAGAEGVGRAATEAFVLAFVAVLVLDFALGLLLNKFAATVWPNAAGMSFGPD